MKSRWVELARDSITARPHDCVIIQVDSTMTGEKTNVIGYQENQVDSKDGPRSNWSEPQMEMTIRDWVILTRFNRTFPSHRQKFLNMMHISSNKVPKNSRFLRALYFVNKSWPWQFLNKLVTVCYRDAKRNQCTLTFPFRCHTTFGDVTFEVCHHSSDLRFGPRSSSVYAFTSASHWKQTTSYDLSVRLAPVWVRCSAVLAPKELVNKSGLFKIWKIRWLKLNVTTPSDSLRGRWSFTRVHLKSKEQDKQVTFGPRTVIVVWY